MSTNDAAAGGTEAGPERRDKRPTASTPKWETDVRERLRLGVRRFAKPLADLVARDANEGDTRLLVTDFLCDVLGFDKYTDLTTEYQVKGEFADYAIRLDKQLVALIEVKRATTQLAERHLRQVEMYAVNEGVEWMLLTNGCDWRAYHMTPGLPVQIDLVIEADLLGELTVHEKVDRLFHLSRESLRRRQIEDVWRAKRATSPGSLVTALLSGPVVEVVRRELRRQTGHLIDTAEVARLLRETVIRTDCI